MAEMEKVEVSRLRLGVPRAMFYEELDVEIEAAMSAALASLKKMTGAMVDVAMTWSNSLPILAAEAWRYHAEWVGKSPEKYQAETLRRIKQGAAMQDAEYERGREELEAMRRASGAIFRDVDLLITPTTAVQAPLIKELLDRPEELRSREMATLRNTRPFNALGLPTISVPCGVTKNGMPIGMQISGAWGDEARVLALGNAWEAISPRAAVPHQPETGN